MVEASEDVYIKFYGEESSRMMQHIRNPCSMCE